MCVMDITETIWGVWYFFLIAGCQSVEGKRPCGEKMQGNFTFAGALEYLSGRDFALYTKRTLSERSEFVLFVYAFSKIYVA